jgi:hypothetical protein
MIGCRRSWLLNGNLSTMAAFDTVIRHGRPAQGQNLTADRKGGPLDRLCY